MSTSLRGAMTLLVSCLLVAGVADATSLTRLSFEQIVDESDAVVSGTVNRTWSEWDAEHRFIWTRSEVLVEGTHKGAAARTVVVNELGGEAEGVSMVVAGSPRYVGGDRVVIFLKKHNGVGYRTLGWAQGRFQVDAAGRVHSDTNLEDVQLTPTRGRAPGVSLSTVDGITLQELHKRIADRSHLGGAK